MFLKMFDLSKWRQFFWPIKAEETKKFLCMLALFFLISFNYNLLRAIKDTLVITAPHSGAEAIPFIKVWAILPMALLMTFVFTRLSNRLDREKVFYVMLGIFATFFVIFTFILYPIRDLLHPDAMVGNLEQILPVGFQGFLAIFRNWTLTLFYVMSELWSTMVLSVLFWGFANEVTTVEEAKRFYILFGVGANVASIFSGQLTSFLSSNVYHSYIPFGKNAWDQSVLYMNMTILFVTFVIMGLFWFLHHKVIERVAVSSFVEKPKMSLRKNFSYLAKSKYLICIAVIVVTYNIAINLVEIMWKNQIKQLYPNPSDYNAYMGQVMTMMGILATLIAVFLSGNMLRKFSWSTTALIPPVIVFVTGIGFFAFFFCNHSFVAAIAMFLGSTPLALTVFFGSLQNCASRAAKYTLFDATKEIAFIPLGSECKLKGKAAIDGVGSRFGKSGGSIIYQIMLLNFATVTASAPYIAGIFLVTVGSWIVAVSSLGKQFNQLIAHKKTLEIEPEKELTSETAPLSNN